jgi:hypothetical protein
VQNNYYSSKLHYTHLSTDRNKRIEEYNRKIKGL